MSTMRKLFAAGAVLAVSMLMFGLNGYAYIDPSVMTYLIQAVAGVVIAIGIYWRRAKKKMADKMGIDENKNKEVESDDIQLN